MSILERLRSGLDSTSTRIIIGVVMMVFILWIPSGRTKKSVGSASGLLADVNGESISEAEFERVRMGVLRQRNGNPSKDEMEQINANVLEELIQAKVEMQEAKALGLAVSDEEVARAVVRTKAFAGEDGKFDEKLYEKLLKQIGMSKAVYESQLHDNLLMDKLMELVGGSVTVSEAEVREAWQKEATRISLTYVRLPTSAFLADVVVSDGDRDKWGQENADKVKARYDERFERQYNLPKRYELRTIVLRTDIQGIGEAEVKARADAVRAEATAGADWDTLAARWSEDLTAAAGGKLGLVAAGQLDPAIVTAADAAGKGKIAEVVKTSRGFQIVRVDDIQEAKVIAFDEAKAEIATQLIREAKVGEALSAYAAKIVDAWKATGVPPTDLLAARELTVESTGTFSLGDGEIPKLGPVGGLAPALATATAGTVLPTPVDVRGAKTILAVTERINPDEATWPAEKDRIRGRLRMERQRAFADAWSKDLIARASITRHAEFGKKSTDAAAPPAQ